MSDVYNSTKKRLLDGTFDFDADTIRLALISNNTSYTPNIDTEEFVDDVLDGGTTAEEFSGTNYSRKTLSNISITQDNSDDEGVFDADDVTFNNIDGDTIQAILIYKQVGGNDLTPGDDVLIAHLTSSDFPLPANGGSITLNFSGEGIINVT